MMLAVISPMSQLPRPYFNSPDTAAHTNTFHIPTSTVAPQFFSRATIAQSKRPQLTVNTNFGQERVFGKKSTSLRLDAVSATTPTARNTLKNAYDSLATVISASVTSPRPLFPQPQPCDGVAPSSPVSSGSTSPASSYVRTSQFGPASSASVSSVSSFGCLGAREPQYLTSQTPPSLYNKDSSLGGESVTIKMSAFAASGRVRRLPKNVSFRDPLAEDIVTTKYTFAHSDIGSEDESPASATPVRRGSGMVEQHPSAGTYRHTQPPTAGATAEVSSLGPLPIPANSLPKDHRFMPINGSSIPNISSNRASNIRNSLKRDSDESGSDGDMCPQTPVSGRRKRRCEWVWTLGPIEKAEAETEPSEDGSASPAETS